MAGGLSGWKQKIVAFAGVLGGPGLFLISFLDSSVLTFPVINDLLLISLSMQHPARMPLYATAAAAGSVLGCVLLYYIAKKGGEAFFHKRAGSRGPAIQRWVERNGFGGMLLAACLKCRSPVLPRPLRWRGRYAISGWGIWRCALGIRRCRFWRSISGKC